MPVFSVITVTFNAEAALEETLRSVEEQEYGRVEHIIVDGASTDGTMDIVRRHAAGLACVVSEPDGGLYDAMNKAMARATGDYLVFLNAGDRFHSPAVLSSVVLGLPLGGWPDVIYGDTAIISPEGEPLRLRRLFPPERLTWRSFRMGMLVCHQSFYVRRALAEPYDLRYRFSADFDWCVRMLRKARTTHNACLILTDFREGGLTSRRRWQSLRERFRIMCRWYGLPVTLACHAWFAVRLLLRRQGQGRLPSGVHEEGFTGRRTWL